ncbi:hypothetical protein HYT54_01725 [Candidatus Woesearchaeota archaeon]|nr:hypothetical protein [Candidatus Woesearchaeota archaeon]
MVKIKKIGILSLGKIMGILYALMGLILGAILSLISLIGSALSSNGFGIFIGMFGIGAIIFLPIFYGVIGFVFGLITALLYNLVASWIGGLEIETEK